MSRQLASALFVVAIVLGGCTIDSGPRRTESNAFSWNGSVPAGKTLYLRNMTGDIRVVATDSPMVRVQASKSWRGSGDGGPTIRLKTVNGSVELKKLS
jgi:hypothetical protein